MIRASVVRAFVLEASSPDPGALADAAFTIARLAYPNLESAPYVRMLDSLGASVAGRLEAGTHVSRGTRIAAVKQVLYEDLGLRGNRSQYDDPRNSFLNDVLDRRTGIPMTLGLVFMEVARRVDLVVQGVNFPGHFLLRCPGPKGDVLLDPFNRGTVLSLSDCERLWEHHVGPELHFDRGALAPASRTDLLARMLLNLKRIYVSLRQFPQARDVAELLVALDPSAMLELRDRGLISYQLRDFGGALRDLEAYLHLSGHRQEIDDEEKRERVQIFEQVKNLRRWIATLN